MLGNNKWRPQDTNFFFSIIIAAVCMIVFAFLCEFTAIKVIYLALLLIFVYLVAVFTFMIYRRSTETLASAVTLDKLFSGELGDVMVRMKGPAVLCTKNGSLIWCNDAFQALFEKQRVSRGTNIEQWTGEKIEYFSESSTGEISISGKSFTAYAISRQIEDAEYRFVFFEDITELDFLREKIADDKVAVAIAMIDSYDEMSQYFQDNFIKIVADIDSKITEWADSLEGIIKSYGKDKFLIVCNQRNMKEHGIANHFAILDRVRENFVGDGIPLTISLGISCIGDTISDVMKFAQAALDTALQRGGDQAVLRYEDGMDFFGGKTKTVYKRSNVRATLVARELSALIARAENVLIMGHRFGDFDSFAATIGIARFCMMCGVKPNIVVKKSDTNLTQCFKKIENIPDYKGMFIEGADGMEKIKSGTLVIVTDVNNFDHVEHADIIKNVSDVVIIDHHIKVSGFAKEPVLTYIEPSASSASELVCEILQTRAVTNKILKEEAELLLAGILLDTKQFTRNTGIRTFSAAMFLRSEGANPIESNELFKDSVEDLSREASFNSNMEIVEKSVYSPEEQGSENKKKLIISYCEGLHDPSYRISASKVADKLLDLKDISATFALVKIENQVHISARSDGTINVQLILERLKGGGHFDVAGAQINGKTMAGAIVMLKDAIDDYFATLQRHAK